MLGKPIAHSLSPLMQNAALAEIAKSDAAYAGSKYFAFEVAPEDLAGALDALREKIFSESTSRFRTKRSRFPCWTILTRRQSSRALVIPC